VLHIGPTRDILALDVGGMKGLADMRLAAKAFRLARDAGRKAAATLRQEAPHVVERLGRP
jgi:hypothetical protein